MWPFRPKTQTPAPSGPQPLPAPVIRRDWATLPPIQRSIGDHPLTAPSDRFSDELAAHQDPSVSSDQMGHQVSAEAPPGLVLALVRPTTRSDGPAMIPRPRVQRRAQSAVAESGEWDGEAAAPGVARPSPIPASLQRAPTRKLPTVAPLPPAPALMALAPDVEPVPVVPTPRRGFMTAGEPAVQRQDDGPMTPTPPARLTLGQARKLGLGAPISRVPDRAAQRAASEPRAMPLPLLMPAESARAPEGVKPSTPPANEEELPAQLSPTNKKDFSVQRSSTNVADVKGPSLELAHPPPRPSPTGGVGDSQPLTPTSEERDSPRPSPTRAEGEPQPSFPTKEEPGSLRLSPVSHEGGNSPPRPSPTIGEGDVTRLSRTRGDGDLTRLSPTPGAAESLGPAAATQRSIAPLVGARPLKPRATLQRSMELAPAALAEPIGRGLASDLTGILVDHSRQDIGSADPIATDAITQTDDITFSEPRRATDSVPLQALVASARIRLAPQPHFFQTSPHPGSTDGQPLDRGAPLLERPSHRFADLPLAPVQRAAMETPPETSMAMDDSAAPVVQRGWFDSVSSEVGSMSSQAPSLADAGSAVSTVGSAIGSMIGSHKAAETDMDELAGKLYDKIRTRLKSELLVDRERAGLLTDLR